MIIDYNQNPKILNEFLNYLYNVKNYSINTIKSYSLDLLCFFKFIKSYYKIGLSLAEFNIFTILNIKEKDIIAFLVYLNYEKDNTAITRQRRLTSIRTFYRWLIKSYPEARLKDNPTKNIPYIEQIVRQPKYLNLEETKKIMNVFTLQNTIYPIRNNTILTLFLNCGLRISELKNINISDINFTYKYINITGKGNKERKVYLNKCTIKQLEKYLNLRNIDINNVSKDIPLFINHQNKRLGIDGISDICKKAFKLIGLEEYHYTAHTLRHTSATILYQYVKPDLLLLKKYLGHNSIKSTEIYIHTNIDNIKNAVNSNPLNNVA